MNFRPNFARYFERRSELFEDFFVLKETAKSFLAASAIESDSRQTLIYWDIGHDTLEKQDKEGWGAKVVERMSAALVVSC